MRANLLHACAARPCMTQAATAAARGRCRLLLLPAGPRAAPQHAWLAAMRRRCRAFPLALILLGLQQQRWIGADAGLSDLISKYVSSGGGADGTAAAALAGGDPAALAAAVAARNCATDSTPAACQPRAVLALQNGGPDTHPPDETGPQSHRPPSGSTRDESQRYHTGVETAPLTWSGASSEQSIAALLLAALGPEIGESLAAEAWGPVSLPAHKWRVYRADGERVLSWADVASAPTLRSLAEAHGSAADAMQAEASIGGGGGTAVPTTAELLPSGSKGDDDTAAAAAAAAAAATAKQGSGSEAASNVAVAGAEPPGWDIPPLYLVPTPRHIDV
jgi:hypothetical protein